MKLLAGISLLPLLLIILSFCDSAVAQTPFYQGKTITIIAGTAPGGGGDHRTKALIPSLRKHAQGVLRTQTFTASTRSSSARSPIL